MVEIEQVVEIATMRVVGVDIRVPNQGEIVGSHCIVLEVMVILTAGSTVFRVKTWVRV